MAEMPRRRHNKSPRSLLWANIENYISNSLVLALRIEEIPETDFKVLEMADKSKVKGWGYMSFQLDNGVFNCRVIARVCSNLKLE